MSYRQKERMKEMVVLPVWVMICFVTPFIGSALESILICVFSLHDQRKAYKAKLRAEFEAELAAAFEAELNEKYIPVCPCGYDDCTWDPAYIKYRAPELYQERWGNKTPEEVRFEPDGCLYCEDAGRKEKNDADT